MTDSDHPYVLSIYLKPIIVESHITFSKIELPCVIHRRYKNLDEITEEIGHIYNLKKLC